MSKKPPRDEFVFDGFEQSNTTPVPDIFFDKLLSKLSGAEIKVLLYIIRRTAGFKKTSDAISLTQFEKGIIKTDGTILDEGCGLSRETICKTLDSLEAKGYIKRHKRNGTGANNDVSLYSVRFKGEPRVVRKSDQVVRKSDQQKGSQINPKKVVRKSDPQETVIQQTERKNGNDNSTKPNASVSSTHSLSSFSLEDASLQDLYARINQLKQQGEELEHLSTLGVQNSQQIVDNKQVVKQTEPLSQLEIELTDEERRIQGYWCELGFVERPSAKKHWSILSNHLQSFEDMKSLYKYTQNAIKDKPNTRVYPGNLVDHLDGWKQKKATSETKAEAPKVMTALEIVNQYEQQYAGKKPTGLKPSERMKRAAAEARKG